jgi:hypothetical protein
MDLCGSRGGCFLPNVHTDKNWCTAPQTGRGLEALGWHRADGATYTYYEHGSNLLDLTATD